MAAAGILALVVLLGLLVPIGLYYLVRSEHGKREQMDRREAERVARQDFDEE